MKTIDGDDITSTDEVVHNDITTINRSHYSGSWTMIIYSYLLPVPSWRTLYRGEALPPIASNSSK